MRGDLGRRSLSSLGFGSLHLEEVLQHLRAADTGGILPQGEAGRAGQLCPLPVRCALHVRSLGGRIEAS